MQTEVSSPVWGETTDEQPQWSMRKTLGAVGIAVLLAAGGAAVIYAVDGGATAQGGFDAPGGGPGGPGGPGPSFGRDAQTPTALHGQFVVTDEDGGFTTQLTQTGTVTEVTDTSITARSADGFVATYTITADTRQTREPAQAGDTATIRGVLTDGVSTATAISPQR